MTQNVKDLVVPVAMVGALLGQVFYLGRASQRLDLATAAVETLAHTAEQQARDEIEMKADIKYLRGELDRQSKALWLLKDYTEGRISRLPYRAYGGGLRE